VTSLKILSSVHKVVMTTCKESDIGSRVLREAGGAACGSSTVMAAAVDGKLAVPDYGRRRVSG